MTLTKEELEEIIWCMEQMASDYQPGELSTKTFDSALIKLEDKLEQMTLK